MGLGARLPNLREQSPARIAAGFGGTLNLVISTLYILLVLLLAALPWHFQVAAEFARGIMTFHDASSLEWWLRAWLVVGGFGSAILGVVATVVPMWVGLRAFRRLEF